MKKIQILGQPRTGTTYLCTAIAQTCIPSFDAFYSEPFNKLNLYYLDKNMAKLEIVQAMHDVLHDWKSSRSVIMKNQVFQLNYLKRKNLLEDFLSADFYTILVLRRDLLQNALSRARSAITQEYFNYSDQVVTIDPDMFVDMLNKTWSNLITQIENPWNICYNEVVYYEDLSGNLYTDIANLKMYKTEEFGPSRGTPFSPAHAPNKQETIVNYAELEATALEIIPKFSHPDITIAGTKFKINLPGF